MKNPSRTLIKGRTIIIFSGNVRPGQLFRTGQLLILRKCPTRTLIQVRTAIRNSRVVEPKETQKRKFNLILTNKLYSRNTSFCPCVISFIILKSFTVKMKKKVIHKNLMKSHGSGCLLKLQM